MPWNAAELLTLQSRRIILKRSLDMKGVAGYELLGGDYIEPRDAFSEKMTIWRRVSKENEKECTCRNNMIQADSCGESFRRF